MKLEEEGAGQRFRIIRPIGEGGMGVVYEAEDRERGQLVALKTLKHRDVDALYRLKREFRALAHLSHPNLVDLHDMIVDGDTGFLTMELVEGTDVIRHCRGADEGGGEARGRFDEGRLRAVLPQLARALVALHRAGMVHRDIKPSNVLVTHGGRVVVLDFGLVAHLDDRGDSLVGRIVGTVEYIAPEQATDRRAAPSADWYGFGCLLYEALTGRPPHQGAILQVLVDKQSHPPAPPRALVPSVPPDLDALCVDLLAIDPAARPDGAEVLRRLGADDDGDRVADPASVASRAAVFVGRELELARLGECARQVDDGGAAVVSIRGPSGIGKTALVRRFLESVRRDGGDEAVVLEGRCYERETVPYKAIDAVIDQLARYWNRLPAAEAAELLPGRAPLLPRLFPVLGRVGAIAAAPRGAVPSDPHELRQGAFSALRHVLRRLAVKRELIVFLDDLQWSDLDSLRLLADLMRPPDPPAMLLVLCSRADGELDEAAIAASGEASVEAPVRHAALEQLIDSLGRWLTRIDLARLPPADAAWLAAQYLPGAREGLAAQVAEEAGGVPLFIAELALHVQIAGADEGRPVSFAQLVRRRVAELPDDARELVELVAVSGEPISQRVAATAVGVPPESLGRAVRHLRAVNLAQAPGGRATDRIECFHGRIRECVRAQIGGDRVRACHRALALALEQWSEGSSAQLARHWSGAGDEARAGEHARAAADEAAGHFDFHRAARFYEMALGAGVGRTAAERRGLRVAMAEALASAGRPGEAAAAFREAADQADPVTALALRHRSATALLRGGHVGEGLAAIEAVLRQIEPAAERGGAQAALAARLAGRVPAALRSRLGGGRLGGLARRWLRPGAAAAPAGSVGEGDVPGRALTEMDVCGSLAVALSLVDPHRGAEHQARFLALALRHPEPHRLGKALALEAGYRAGEGRYRRAERVAARAERVIAETGDERLAPYALWVRGALAMTRDSAWRAALGCFRQATGLLRQQERASSWEMSICEQHVSVCRLFLGELGALAETMPASVRAADLRGDRYAALSARLRFGTVLHLLRGDPGQAARDLDEALSAWAGQRGRSVGDYAAAIARADLCLYTGRPGELGAQARLQPNHLARSRVARYPMALRELAYAGGRIAVALGAVEQARGHAALLRRDGAPASLSLARLLDAGVAARARDRRTAVAALSTALGELDRLEMATHAAATRRALGLLHGAGGGDLVGEADAALRAQGVAEPARFAAMVVVGIDLGRDRRGP